MKSPFTGGDVELKREEKERIFRKEKFEIIEHYYVCKDTDQEFTTGDLDNLNVNQVYNQYRERNGIPFPDQIRNIREKYGLSATKMAEILGFGVNIYRNYEQGDIPNTSNGRLILAADDPEEFKKFVEISKNKLSDREYYRLIKKTNELIIEKQKSLYRFWRFREIFTNELPNEYTGYRLPDLHKIANLIIFFSDRMKTWKTKLNKLLFYSDFLSYNYSGFGISGIDYKAINLGPVPSNFDKIYSELTEQNYIERIYEEFNNGNFGEHFIPIAGSEFNQSLFEENELKVMEVVASFFKNMNTNKVINLSHQEPAWLDCKYYKGRISYKRYGFTVKGVKSLI
jgi:transcriptional regulator with XRE-family HTH domain